MAHFGLNVASLGWVLPWVAFACSAPAPLTVPAPAAPTEPEPALVAIQDADWKTVLLSQFGLLLPLPEASNWRRLETDSWWSAEHRPTRSIVEIKSWKQGQLVDADDCESQARLWKPDLERSTREETVVYDPAVEIAGYRSRVTVLSRGAPGAAGVEKTVGIVLVFGASVRSCLALRFVTSALGQNAPSVVASRLALISEAVLPKLARREIDARVDPVIR